ncbi:hypothetical protein ACI3WX_000486 [Escherichia coli]|uniref:hypothetical protein n=1 Tax=Escherichia coli TaxID=562 RepID=UPI000BE4FF3B|nr:hypothetical protein [Escherichia coli]EEQ2597198.1 hypothetical protein [Escherichia coli]EEQ4335262.1 hypothetical protein [Escherichia coli]EEQ9545146.1 hypothetical protein [Escherichia coli]EEQ9574900.1 hypothetical protein [Escherichia coli]EER2012197.1 hypothetical protein [Escherichia coli]
MKQKLPAYLHHNKLSEEQRNLKNPAHYVFWLLTLIPSHTPDKRTMYLSYHRAMSDAQQESNHITPARLYQAIDEMIDMNVIMCNEFKYQYRLNPDYFTFIS